MSHFSVLVIGPNVVQQLAPYHEFECTGDDNEYVIDVDVTEQIRADFAKYSEENESFADWYEGWSGHQCILQNDAALTTVDGVPEEMEFGYAIIDADGNLVKAINHTNPNAQWDWYQVGGRWSNWLRLKPPVAANAHLEVLGSIGYGERSWTNKDEPSNGDHCDYAPKGLIDFEWMRNETGEKAGKEWDLVNKVTEGNGWTPWKNVLAKKCFQATSQRLENSTTASMQESCWRKTRKLRRCGTSTMTSCPLAKNLCLPLAIVLAHRMLS
jgi:hypothetical protein